MKTYKDLQQTKRVVDQMVCDLCKKMAPLYAGDQWEPLSSSPQQDHETVRVEYSISRYDYGDSSGERVEYDICPDCFKAKLRPWLESQGAKATVKEW